MRLLDLTISQSSRVDSVSPVRTGFWLYINRDCGDTRGDCGMTWAALLTAKIGKNWESRPDLQGAARTRTERPASCLLVLAWPSAGGFMRGMKNVFEKEIWVTLRPVGEIIGCSCLSGFNLQPAANAQRPRWSPTVHEGERPRAVSAARSGKRCPFVGLRVEVWKHIHFSWFCFSGDFLSLGPY